MAVNRLKTGLFAIALVALPGAIGWRMPAAAGAGVGAEEISSVAAFGD